MVAYIDTSALLRILLKQPNALQEWSQIDRFISSALIAVEGLRAVDRIRLRGGLSDIEIARLRRAILEMIAEIELVEIDASILDRAAQPMPTELGALDAIHLTSALLWQQSSSEEIYLATHDRALAVAAQAYGMKVLGVPSV